MSWESLWRPRATCFITQFGTENAMRVHSLPVHMQWKMGNTPLLALCLGADLVAFSRKLL